MMKRCLLLALAALATAASARAPAPPRPVVRAGAAERAAIAAAHIPPEIVSLPPASTRLASQQNTNMLFWTQAEQDNRFRMMDRLYPGTVVRAGGHIRALPPGRPLAIAAADVTRVMGENNVAGLLVVTDGRIRLERYARGYGRGQRYTSFSMAKSFTATLVGMAMADGFIRSIDDPMTAYLPELKGSAYDGVSLRQALMMMSGVEWDETYENPAADVSRMFRDPPPAGEDSTIAYMRRLHRAAPPGTKWHYSTGESALIGVLVKRATGKPLAQYLSEKVWRPYGMERDAFWMVDWSFNEMGGCCLSATLRDNARFGMFIMDGAQGKLAREYWETMTKPLVPLGNDTGYGYQWWNFPHDAYGAMGHGGQLIIVHPGSHTVIAVNSAMNGSADPERRARFNMFLIRLIELARADKTRQP